MKRYTQVCSIATLIGAAVAAQAGTNADVVLLHGRIITMDSRDQVAEALAIADGRIMQVGRDREIQQLVGPATQVMDLRGRGVTPGLIDAHAHVLSTGLSELFEIDLSDTRNMSDIIRRVAQKAEALKPGEWILGGGWDEGKLAEHRYPSAAELDHVAPANPVWLYNTTGHFGVANAAALKLAGIGAATPAPAAGVIERGADGQPDGILKESAMDPILAALPPYSQAQRALAVGHMVEIAHSEGMTGFKDPDIDQDDWAAYRNAAAEGRLNEYVCVLFHTPPTPDGAASTLAQIRAAQHDVTALSNSTLGVCGAKIYMDGSGVGRTGWMYADWNRSYSDTDVDTGNHGFPALDPTLYRRQVELFVAAGVSVGTHAVGDRAIDWVVDTYAEALRSRPTQGLRLAIIHANIPTDHAIAAMADLQKRFDSGIPETQPEFIWWLGDAYPASYGAARSLRMIPLRAYLDKDMIWAGGSDANVTPLPARYGLWASVARESLNGSYGRTPFGMAQSVDIHAALRSYTIWAARQLFIDKETGSLERGKFADIAIWDRDLYKIHTAQLKDIVCDATIFKGKLVYERNVSK
jgi:predicted amidohydrolase YtcJ